MTKPSKSSKLEYQPKMDRYYKIKQTIEGTTNAIKMLKCKEKVTKDDGGVIGLLKDQNAAYEEKIEALYEFIESISQERDECKEGSSIKMKLELDDNAPNELATQIADRILDRMKENILNNNKKAAGGAIKNLEDIVAAKEK